MSERLQDDPFSEFPSECDAAVMPGDASLVVPAARSSTPVAPATRINASIFESVPAPPVPQSMTAVRPRVAEASQASAHRRLLASLWTRLRVQTHLTAPTRVSLSRAAAAVRRLITAPMLVFLGTLRTRATSGAHRPGRSTVLGAFLLGVSVGALVMRSGLIPMDGGVALSSTSVEAAPERGDVALSPDASHLSTPPTSPILAVVATSGAGTTPAVRRTVAPQRALTESPPKPSPPRPQAAAPRSATTAPPQFRGSLTVRSRPAGASVFINGRLIGTTPLVLANEAAGSRAVRVTLDGYEPWTAATRVVANKQTAVSAELRQSGEVSRDRSD